MRISIITCIAGVSAAVVGLAPPGVEALESEVFGYSITDCPEGSDSIVSAPFVRAPAWRGATGGLPRWSVDGDTAEIIAAGNPNFHPGQFSDEPHYLTFTSASSRSGWSYRIAENDPASVTIDLAGDDLAGVAEGDTFEVIPFWTLGTLFPDGNETIHESSGLLVSERGTEILFFDRDTANVNLAPSRKFFQTDAGWREVAPGFPAADEVIIPPGSSFVIRHPAGAGGTRFVASQWVEEGKQAYVLETDTTGARDHHLGSARPVPVKVGELDLEPPAFAESASTDPGDRADELHVYDNTVAAVNRQASTIYFRVSGQWFRDEAGFPVGNDDEIAAGAGLMIRKAPTATGGKVVWMNTPRY